VATLGSSERGPVGAPGRVGGAADRWPQEVRKLLFEAHEEAAQLRSEREMLLNRGTDLERRLEAAQAQVKALVDQVARLERQAQRPRPAQPLPERPQRQPQPQPQPQSRWLGEVADRTAAALRSGQETAQSLVERAGRRAQEIERSALQDAAAIRAKAEAEAARVMRMADYDAEGILHGAQASAEELLGEARKAAAEVMTELYRRRDALTRDIDALEGRRLSLLRACAGIRKPVDEAIRALEQAGPEGARPGGQRGMARGAREALSAALATTRRPPGHTPDR